MPAGSRKAARSCNGLDSGPGADFLSRVSALLKTIPDSINYDQEQLRIRWKDGAESAYNLLNLRKNCPCAQCRGGHDPNAQRTTGGITAITLLGYKKVGRYALQLTFSDSHDTGIYTYDALRLAHDEGRDYVAPEDRL